MGYVDDDALGWVCFMIGNEHGMILMYENTCYCIGLMGILCWKCHAKYVTFVYIDNRLLAHVVDYVLCVFWDG